jgi:hypothetical protein
VLHIIVWYGTSWLHRWRFEHLTVTDARNRDSDSSEFFRFRLPLQENYGNETDHDYVFPVPAKLMKNGYLITAMDAK